jgi:hypothetical protein
MGMRIGIDPANRDVRNSTHPNLTQIDPHGIVIHRLGRIRSYCMGMGVGIDPANRHVRNSRHPKRKHIDPFEGGP